MQARREKDRIVMTTNAQEARVLREVLQTIADYYGRKPQELDARARAAWYSTRGCEAAGLSPDETSEWLEQLHGFRSARRERLAGWSRQLAEGAGRSATLHLSLEDAPAFVTALNDHRLLLAAQHDIGEAEMDARSIFAMLKLPPAQQRALFEVHLLAWFIEVVLRALEEGQAA
ncbi:MAG TPA: DUF2017 family protein [Methylomirabilota bacterium]|nr:DUF2017 family protein [Methylomirabilota bacterium]